jgi:hypothetical protein
MGRHLGNAEDEFAMNSGIELKSGWTSPPSMPRKRCSNLDWWLAGQRMQPDAKPSWHAVSA